MTEIAGITQTLRLKYLEQKKLSKTSHLAWLMVQTLENRSEGSSIKKERESTISLFGSKLSNI